MYRIKARPPGIDADDAVQDAVLLILKRVKQFLVAPTDVCPFIAWIYMRVQYDLRGQYRREWKRNDEVQMVPLEPGWFDHLPDPRSTPADRDMNVATDEQALRLAIECLGRKQREVVKAFYLRRRTQQQIAKARGISQPAVHRILYRGLVNLRRILLADGMDTFEQSDPPELLYEKAVTPCTGD